MGVSVVLNNINSSVSTHVTGGSVKAANNIDIKAEEVRKFDSSVTGVAVGGIGVGVNVAVTSINKGITDAQLSNTTDENGNSTGTNKGTKDEINVHLNGTRGVNNAKGNLGKAEARFFGLNSEDKKDLDTARNTTVSLSSPTYEANTPDTKKQGVHTEVGGTLTAAGNVNVAATEKSDIFEKNVNATVGGGISASVTDAIIHTNYDTDVNLNNANITGKNVTLEAHQGQAGNGSEIEVKAGAGGLGIGVGVGYAGIVNKGATDINITGSTIKGTENVTVNALDESKHKAQILNVGVGAIGVATTFASVENKNNVGVTLAGTNNISATQGNITIDAQRANVLNAHTQGVGVGGVNVSVNHATIEDGGKDENNNVKGLAVAKITGTNGTYSANSFHLGATNDTTANLSSGNTTVAILGVSRMRGKGVMDMGAEVSVAGGTFNSQNVDFTSRLGSANGRTLEGNVKGHNVSVGAVAPDAVILTTNATAKVNVANSTFGENTNLTLDNRSYVDRKAYIYDVTVGGVAVGNSSADISGTQTLTTSLTGKNGVTNKLAGLQVETYGENTGKALADAGGGSIVGYIGSHVDNKSTNTVNSTLGGNWDVAGKLWLVAAQKDDTRLTATEGHGGVIGVGGTSVDNIIDTTLKANVEEGTVVSADRVHIGTSSAVATGAYDDTNANGDKDEQSYTLKDHFGGVISGNRLRSLLKVTESGSVTIGKNARITTNNLQEYVASSNSNLTNHASAKGGAAAGVVDTVVENNIAVNNLVDVKSGALLSNEQAATTEDIILAAYDEHKLNSHAEATVGGAVGVMTSDNNVTMNRTSKVNVAGTIESGSKVGLYAGANEGGVLSNLNADLKAGTYNHTAIPVTIPSVNYGITADKGMVEVSGIVRSTGDINVIASGGKEEVVKDESLFNWVKGGNSTEKKFLTSDAVTAEETSDDMKKSTVNVTGSLIAGTAAPINLTISGSVAGGLHFTADNNVTNQRVLQGITKGTFDYANTLGGRLRELNKLIAAYNGDSSKMAAYIAERGRIQEEMKRLGLVEKDADGNVVQYLTTGRPVYYVGIPDIAVSGGNINVQANDLTGTGNLHANAAPAVTITNESDAYLKLNNILMGEQGGSIIYNKDNVIPPGKTEGNNKINAVNVHKTGAAFNEIYGVTDSTAAGLTVQNTKTFSGDKTSTISLTPELEQEIDNNTEMTAEEKTNYKQDIRNGKMKYTAITDVEVGGKISNFYGNVTISNASGDIIISGGTQARPTGVFGNTVKLIAANGSIAQNYKEGIVNINGDPEKYLAGSATAMKDALGLSATGEDSKSKEENYTRTDSSQEATGYIAGRDVYVSAANVNVNGLIQSGYKTYAATVTEEQLAAAKQRPASRAAVIQNHTMYKVNDGGAQWNSTDKAFDYVPQVYWDPATNKLVVEDIDTAGGKVYLTGKIASTGDGRILAADGAAEISVINQTNLDMNVGNVLNNQREGVITIADTAKDTWTEYKRGQTRTITGYADYLKNHSGDTDIYAGATQTANNLSVGNTISYGVEGGQLYTWVNGYSVETTRTYQHYERRGMWGLVQTADETELRGWSTDSNVIDKKEGAKIGLPDGAVITTSANVPASGKLHLDGHTTLLNEKVFDQDHWVTRSGFLGWFKHIYDRWKVGTSTIQLYNYSINASQPLTIGLLGAEVGKIDIKSTNAGGGSINLTGNVANSHNQAALTVSSAAGGITQFDNTTLKSEIVNLAAKNDIKNIHLASIGTATKDGSGNITAVNDNIKLSAVSTGKGDIDITAVGGILENRSLPGNVEIVELKSKDGSNVFAKNASLGDVTLNAAGNITQSGSGITVEGRGITLTSKEGGIGTEAQAINIAGSDLIYSTDRYGAQISASAKNSIYLTEAADGGDMRVGKIESREGDVKLTVNNGGFIDGLPGNDKSGSTDSVDEMVHRWIDAGLIDGEKDANGNYTYKGAYIEGLEKDRDAYKAAIEVAYDTTKGGKTQAEWQETAAGLPAGSVAYKTASKYAQYADANAYLAADTDYQKMKAKADNPTFEWTKDMMLNAVSEKLVNPEGGGSTQTERAANVLGKDITLTATKGAVGTFDNNSTTITVEQLTGSDNIAYMKQLMNVSASDVTVKRDESGNLMAFEIKGNMPLGIKASGTLNVSAGGNVFVAGRKDENGEHSAIKVGTIDATQNSATGDVRLYSEQGIYNDKTADDTNIKGNNLILTGGKESIGTAEKALTISLSGDLTEARADKNVFINNVNNNDFLRLGAMFAGDTIFLNSEKGFKMSNANADIAASYINAGKKLEFKTNTATGIVGEADNAIRLLNDRAPVNIAAQSAYIKGMGSLAQGIQNGTLVLGDIRTVGEFAAVSAGSLTVGREQEKDSTGTVKKEAVAGAITAGGNVNLEAADSLTLDGKVKAGNLTDTEKVLTLKAVNGNITQTDKGVITADAVKTFNGKSLLLENAANEFNNIEVDGIETTAAQKPAIAGDVRIKDNAAALTVAIKRQVAGDIVVHNLRENGTLANNGDLTAAGNIALNAQGTLQQTANTTFTAGKNVELSSAAADIKQADDAGIKANKVTAVSAKTADLQGTGNTFQSITLQGAIENTPLAGNVLVGTTADTLSLAVQPVVQGNIVAENRAAHGSLQVSSALQAQDDDETDAHVIGDISLTAGGDVLINGDITTGTKRQNSFNTFTVSDMLGDSHNSFTIKAGGAIMEAANVKIETPMVTTYSGKDVSLTSGNNKFAIVLTNGLLAGAPIDGSVKAVSNYDGIYVAGVATDKILGDAEFANISSRGDLRFLVDNGTDGEKIDVRGGNGAQGNLLLTAGKDVTILGNAVVKNDVTLASNVEGSIYGLGRGIEAGHNVFMLAEESVNYIGTIKAENDIRVQVWNAASAKENRGINIGTLSGIINREEEHSTIPTDSTTLLTAGRNAEFFVHGNGDIELLGKVEAETGAVTVDISDQGDIYIGQPDVLDEKTITAKGNVTLNVGQGNIAIVKGIESQDESIKLATGKGNIIVGRENVTDEESLIASKNVSIGTNTGTITIQGKTATANGDVSMTAGQDVYEPGILNGNFIIKDDGKISSGGGINLYGRNGDIYITDKISARKGLTAVINERGNVIFETDVMVDKDVNISTEKGFIGVGHTISADEGMVNLNTGSGDIMVGKDITAGEAVSISTYDGNVLIGDTATGDDGDVLAENGDVSIRTNKGDIQIIKTVTASDGSIDITSGQGDILVGDNGPDVKTVTAGENINLTANDGRIVVYGKTSTGAGDISLSAHRQEQVSGVDSSTFVIDHNGKLEAAKSIRLDVEGGDLHVSEVIQAREDMEAELQGIGSVYFDTDVDVTGNIKIKTDEGDINVGHDVKAAQNIAMTADKGNINVGSAIESGEGNVALATNLGIVDVGGSVTANKGSIDVQVETGGVNIGNNGPDVETVTAKENIDISVGVGQVKIYGKTSTKNGDISMAAGAEAYTQGERNFIIEQNGLLESGRDINLTGRNGDLHVTDAIKANRNLNAKVNEGGGIFFDKTATLTGDVTAHADAGPIRIAGQIDANLVDLTTGQGSITVGGDINSETTVTISAGTGNISLQNITALGDVKVSNTESGFINGKDFISAGITHVELTYGDLFLNLAEGKAVVLKMEDNTEASKVNNVLAEASGDTGADVAMTGNYIQIGSVTAKRGDSVFELSAMGAGNKKLIDGFISIDSLSAKSGTHVPNIWANGGYVHVAEGQLRVDDVLAVDKIHVDNDYTDIAVYGRTPTRDGEQLAYWNNLSMADSKMRGYQLYADGYVRTNDTVLVDAGRNLWKLYGDNLSVVDFMSERETNRHGTFTFDRRTLTEPGQKLTEEVIFDPKLGDFAGIQPDETNEDITVETE